MWDIKYVHSVLLTSSHAFFVFFFILKTETQSRVEKEKKNILSNDITSKNITWMNEKFSFSFTSSFFFFATIYFTCASVCRLVLSRAMLRCGLFFEFFFFGFFFIEHRIFCCGIDLGGLVDIWRTGEFFWLKNLKF